MTAVRVDHGVTNGTFSLDGETFDVDNNVWVVGDDVECVVIDAPHDVDAIMAVVGDRQPLQHAHRGRDRKRRHGDRQMRRGERVGTRHGRSGLTISLPTIAWCPMPQYSLQVIRYSPGRVNVVVNWLT